MKKIEKDLIKQALRNGVVTGSLFSLIILIVRGNSENFVLLISFCILGAIFLNFFTIYRVNCHIHLKLKGKYGIDYTELVDSEYRKMGIKKMLGENWFDEIARQDRDGELLKRFKKIRESKIDNKSM